MVNSVETAYVRGPVEIDGSLFRLSLDATGKPYVLKRRSVEGKWTRVWAEWHKGLPTGTRKRAVEAMGFVWKNGTRENLGWHSTGAQTTAAP